LESQPRVTFAASASGTQGPETKAKGNNRRKRKKNRIQEVEGRRPKPVFRLRITDFRRNKNVLPNAHSFQIPVFAFFERIT
jgi:hypothetical protein